VDLIGLFDIINSAWGLLFLLPFFLPLVGYICWKNPYEYNSFEACVTAIGGNQGTIMIPNEQEITDNLIIPSNITLQFIQGGFFTVSAGKTVTINGQVESPPIEIFQGAGTVVVNTFPYDEIWWGNDRQVVLGGEFALTLVHDGDLRLSMYSYSNNVQDNPTIKQYRGRGTRDARVIVQQNDPCGEWTSYGFDGNTWIRVARIYMDVDGVPGLTDMPGRIDFECTPAAGITPIVGMSLRNDLELVLSGKTLTWDVADTVTIRNTANRDMIIEPGDDLIITLKDDAGAGSFFIRDNALVDVFHVGSGGNVGIGTQAFGANSNRVLAIYNGVAPTASIANQFQMYSADQVAGNACPHIRTENNAILKLYQCAKADYNNWAAFGDVVDALVAMGIFDVA